MVVSLLFNVMEVFRVCGGGGDLLNRLYWSNKECTYCVCDPIVHLSVPSIGFVYV